MPGGSYLQRLLEQEVPDEIEEPLLKLLGSTMPRAGEPPRYEIAACGRFHGSQLPELMAYVRRRQWSGALVLIDGDAERALLFQDGLVSGSTSTVLFERLGRLLYRAEVVTKDDSSTLVDAEERHGVEALLMWLSAQQLQWAVQRRVWEVGAALTLVKRGQFLFVEGAPDADGPPTAIEPGDVAHEGLRLQQEMGSGASGAGEKLAPIPMPAPPPRSQRELRPIDVSGETIREIVKRIREAEVGGS